MCLIDNIYVFLIFLFVAGLPALVSLGLEGLRVAGRGISLVSLVIYSQQKLNSEPCSRLMAGFSLDQGSY